MIRLQTKAQVLLASMLAPVKKILNCFILLSGLVCLAMPTNSFSGDPQEQILEYAYADGSNNAYHIKNAKEKMLEYLPVKPKTSSSGVYDGGEHQLKRISLTDYQKIVSRMEAAIQNEKIQIKNRIMMSGMITITKKSKTESWILKPNCQEQTELENILKQVLTAPTQGK